MEANWATFCLDPGPISFEYRTAPRDGASRVLTEQVVAAVGTAGFIGTITDITDRVEARAHLRLAETLSHYTFDVRRETKLMILLSENQRFWCRMGDGGRPPEVSVQTRASNRPCAAVVQKAMVVVRVASRNFVTGCLISDVTGRPFSRLLPIRL
jgi:hypothetical protein